MDDLHADDAGRLRDSIDLGIPGVPEVDDDPEWLEPEDCTDEELRGALVDDGLHDEQHRRRLREARERWRHLPDEPLPEVPLVEPATVGSVFRALRWHRRWNQRELAAAAGVTLSTVSRAEAGGGWNLRLSTLAQVLAAGDLRLVVVDGEGTQLAIPFGQDHFHDAADRRLPAHQQTYDPRRRYWWGHGLLGEPDPRHPEPARVHVGRPKQRGGAAP